MDSLTELAPKTSTPSATSSGYGSQAVSSTNLSSDDSLSLKSISVDETPDFEHRVPLNLDLEAVTETIDIHDDHYTEPTKEQHKNDESSDEVLANGLENDTNQNPKSDLNESSSVIKTNLPGGRVVRRKKTTSKNQQRSSFPQAKPNLSESRAARYLENSLANLSFSHDDGMDSSTDRLEEEDSTYGSRPDLTKISDVPVPEWVVLGESVLIRPYNSSGVVAYIGETEFANGTWIGVELDAPKGKLQ